MEEKYYIDIDSNRKILGRYLLSFHGNSIPYSAKEVTKEVFELSIEENHNSLNDDLTTGIKEFRNLDELKQLKIYFSSYRIV